MAHWIDDVYDLCEIVMDELSETKEKLKGGQMSAGDLEVIDKLSHTAKSLKTIIAMEENDFSEQGGQSGARGGRGGNRGGGRSREGRSRESYEGGMSNARRRDSMGRYSRDGFIDKLMDMKESAPNEKSRRAIEKMIDELEN